MMGLTPRGKLLSVAGAARCGSCKMTGCLEILGRCIRTSTACGNDKTRQRQRGGTAVQKPVAKGKQSAQADCRNT
jgi:hypothetical protein